MSLATKSAAETADGIAEAIDETKARLVQLSRDLEAARVEAIRNGTVCVCGVEGEAGPEADRRGWNRVAELEEEQALAGRLVAEEEAQAVRARVDAIKTEADDQRTRELAAWSKAREAFTSFVATVAKYQGLVQHGLDVRASFRHEFASDQTTLLDLMRAVRPAVTPTPTDLAQVVDVLCR